MTGATAPAPARPPVVTVPRLWPGSTIVCIGSGPSLTQVDVDACRDARYEGSRELRAIAINDAHRLVPWADVVYAADSKWWRWHRDILDDQLPPLKYTIDRLSHHWRPSVQTLNYTGVTGLELSPASLRTGGHGGYQAINLAVHLGASQILLLGYDMQPADDGRNHFFGEHPDKNHPKYAHRLGAYQTLVAPLADLGISVINASRRTAIRDFPCARLEDVLPWP